ncbi:MAG: imidazoleglycerol-phosphate dehydratase HisB [Planctomycetota bacterium]|nr:imidazoleglycerol-phosphate dehydratase HisB [Planctomycetota bacterium]
MSRIAKIERNTLETKIQLSINLDGSGLGTIRTGVGFFDHMLTLFAKHSLLDIELLVDGDIHIDAHHTVEDTGIALGKALVQAVGDKAGIRRYGHAVVPMDESLATAAIDLSGRPFLVFRGQLPQVMIGQFPAELAEEFFRGFSSAGLLNLHLEAVYGSNSHHLVEALFKATGRALRQAVENDPRVKGIPSTKGIL